MKYRVKIQCVFSLSFICLFTSLTLANEDLRQYMLQNLDFIGNVFESRYAPYEWKKSLIGWELDQEIAIAKKRVDDLNPVSIKTYHRIVEDLLLSTQDYHVGYSYFSTESAQLPFTIRKAYNRYYVVFIDNNLISPNEEFPLSIGDEILAFDDKPIAHIANEIQHNLSQSSTKTDAALSELYLTRRSGARALDIPQGTVSITVRHKRTRTPVKYDFAWIYSPELINNEVIENNLLKTTDRYAHSHGNNNSLPPLLSSAFKRDMTTYFWDEFRYLRLTENPQLLGTRKSYIPPLGRIMWSSSDNDIFHAYIYKIKNKKIGYVRIPSYLAGYQEIVEMTELVKRFEESTDALVIDQINNPGGSLFYLYALVSLFADKPFVVPTMQENLTQEDIFIAIQDLQYLAMITNDQQAIQMLGHEIGGYPVSYDLVKRVIAYYQYIIDQWNSGKRLTDDYHFYGVDSIHPNPEVHYSKPILMLNNSLDFSGADFFPAILQDNDRVTILGEQTSGAGGYVLAMGYLNHLAINKIYVTGSIAHRANGHPIENLGVTPDYHYSHTPRDYTNNYQNYIRKINRTVLYLAY